MMFKWSKAKRASGEPTTPKIGCAQLPESFSPIPVVPDMKHSFWSRFTPDRHRSQSTQPQPLLFQGDPHSPRGRTTSMGDNKFVVHKPIPIKPTPIKPIVQAPKSILKKTSKYNGSSTTSLPLERKPSQSEYSEQVLKPLKSALKGGSFQQGPTVYVKPAIPSPDSSSQSSTSPVNELGDKCSGCQVQRKRFHSLTEQRPAYTTSNRTPKYMKAYIKEVSMKDEAIALSWPLVDYAARKNKGTPMLYFDIGFDPRQDDWAVRVYRGGYASPMAWEESHIPVSPHTVLTEMVIVCNTPVSSWELGIQRTRGVRVVDVFRQVYNTYNNVLTEVERAQIDPRYLERCLPAFKQRCRDCPGLTLYNEKCGIRRVDLLRGRRIFKGLSPILGKPGFWLLQFDEPPRSQTAM